MDRRISRYNAGPYDSMSEGSERKQSQGRKPAHFVVGLQLS